MVRTWFTRSTSFCNLSYIFNPFVWFEKVSSSQILWYFFISPHFFTSYLQFNINKSDPKHNTKQTLERCLQTFFFQYWYWLCSLSSGPKYRTIQSWNVVEWKLPLDENCNNKIGKKKSISNEILLCLCFKREKKSFWKLNFYYWDVIL